jgi:hypothetical protein
MSLKTYLAKKKKAAPKKKIVRKKKVARKKAGPKKTTLAQKLVVKAKKYAKKLTKTRTKKKISEQAILSKIHRVKKDVDVLDEAQHKHMMSGVGKLKRDIAGDYAKVTMKGRELESGIFKLQNLIKTPGYPTQLKAQQRKLIKLYKLLLRENKTHASQLKKLM